MYSHKFKSAALKYEVAICAFVLSILFGLMVHTEEVRITLQSSKMPFEKCWNLAKRSMQTGDTAVMLSIASFPMSLVREQSIHMRGPSTKASIDDSRYGIVLAIPGVTIIPSMAMFLVLWLSAITQIAIENDEPRVVWDYNESQD